MIQDIFINLKEQCSQHDRRRQRENYANEQYETCLSGFHDDDVDEVKYEIKYIFIDNYFHLLECFIYQNLIQHFTAYNK